MFKIFINEQLKNTIYFSIFHSSIQNGKVSGLEMCTLWRFINEINNDESPHTHSPIGHKNNNKKWKNTVINMSAKNRLCVLSN